MNTEDQSFLPFEHQAQDEEEMRRQGQSFFTDLDRRRSIRFFSDKPVPRDLIELAIRTASTAPSGAHMQPWTFVAVSDPELKHKIRLAAEKEEYLSYEGGRMTEEWKADLRPLGTDWQKPFLETVPWIVVVFAQGHGLREDGSKKKHYYVKESVGIACGFFIAALHRMGLCTLTHTPSPMNFLRDLLGRPKNESAFILFPIGYPSSDCVVPNLQRKILDDVAIWFGTDGEALP